MKESDYKKELAKHLVNRDQHLALNMEQAKQLVEYIRAYEDKAGMLPPDTLPGSLSLSKKHTEDAEWARTRFKWENEDE